LSENASSTSLPATGKSNAAYRDARIRLLEAIQESGKVVSHRSAGVGTDHEHEQVTIVARGAMVGDELPDTLGGRRTA
jgi:hypothetical protein